MKIHRIVKGKERKVYSSLTFKKNIDFGTKPSHLRRSEALGACLSQRVSGPHSDPKAPLLI